MSPVLTCFAVTVASCSLFILPSNAIANEAELNEKAPIAHALGKKINKEVQICLENGSAQTHEFENQKHLKLMMPDTVARCEKGVKSACQVKKSVLIAMEVANNKG